jgi:hypothetical protein
MISSKGSDNMDATLNATTDKNGETLAVGDLVRSYDFPTMDLDIYTEGILQAIGNDNFEGCPRYRILIVRHHRPISNTRDARDIEYEFVYPHHDAPPHIFPPINGIPTWFDKLTDGVIKVESL